MKALLHYCLFAWLIVFTATVYSAAPTNLIVNGNFASDSGWNSLGQYDGGQGTGKIENNSYIIDISAPGNVPWSIQFTQNRILLDSGSTYIFSYDIYSTIDRTVEVSLSRNGGDYASYSGRDTVKISSMAYHSQKRFVMKNPTDSDVRLEFNCGKAAGKITLQNIKLVQFTEPSLTVGAPHGDELLIVGEPYTITWSGLNIGANVRIDLSADNGANWKTIGTAPADSGKFVWVPGTYFSPWCRIRVSSISDTGLSALNEGPFECVPRRELVANSRFNLSAQEWKFGVYGGTATGGMHQDNAYLIHIEKGAEDFWQIQLTQNGISLEKGQTYLLSLTASAARSADIKINIGMDREPYISYFDTTKWILTLSATPKRFTIPFTMNLSSDSCARLEFNCGKSSGDIYIDEISVVPDYVAPVAFVNRVAPREDGSGAYRAGLMAGNSGGANSFFGAPSRRSSGRLIDLRGRTVGQAQFRERGATGLTTERHVLPGLYIIKCVGRQGK